MKRGGGCPSPGVWSSVRDHSITTAPGLINSNAPRTVDVKYMAISLYCVLGMLPWQRRERGDTKMTRILLFADWVGEK